MKNIIGAVALLLIVVSLCHAETVELVTYFPAGGGGGTDPQFNSVRVGAGYAVAPVPGNGVALVFSSLGIGIPVGGGDPDGTLEVRGGAGQPDQALFLPGTGGTLNVGIGTNNPQFEAEIALSSNATATPPAGAGAVGLSILNTDATANNWAGIVFPQAAGANWEANGAGIFAQHISRTGGARQTALAFFTQSSGQNAAEKMRIDQNGNMGIGTATPQSTLDLGDATAGRSLVWGGPTGTNHYASIGTAQSSAALSLLYGLRLDTTADQYLYSFATLARAGIRLDGDISFFNEASAAKTVGSAFNRAANTKMVIKTTGEVGIGTAAPNAGAAVQIDSTTRGFLPPRMTPGQRDAIAAPPEGLVIYNLTDHRLEVRTNVAWMPVGGGRTEVGTYVGDGTANRNINVGFDPRAVFVTSSSQNTGDNRLFFTTDNYPPQASGFNNALITENINTQFQILTLTATGFRLRRGDNTDLGFLNRNGTRYYYVAVE